MMVFFTSDLHLGHKKVLSIRKQFHDIKEHDDFLIEKWNNKVKKNDEVYILGDLSFRSNRAHLFRRMRAIGSLMI